MIKDNNRLIKIHLVHTQVHCYIHGRVNFQNIITAIVRTQQRLNENNQDSNNPNARLSHKKRPQELKLDGSRPVVAKPWVVHFRIRSLL